MKIVIYAIILLCAIESNTQVVIRHQVVNDKILNSVYRLSPKIAKDSAYKIASAVERITSSNSCNIPWQILISIAFNESSFNISAINKKTLDYGIAQISIKNIKRMGLNTSRLLSDPEYSMHISCKLLMYNKKYKGKFSSWLGMYRSGTAIWKKEIRKNAESYNKIVLKTAYLIGYRDIILADVK